jgi:hypothetical protein
MDLNNAIILSALPDTAFHAIPGSHDPSDILDRLEQSTLNVRNSDALDLCIAAAYQEAAEYQNGSVGDFMANLESTRKHLDQFITNMTKRIVKS